MDTAHVLDIRDVHVYMFTSLYTHSQKYTIGTSLLETRQGCKAIETTTPTTATKLADWLASYTGTGQIIVLGDDDNAILNDTKIS